MPATDPYAAELEFVKSLASEAAEIALGRCADVRPQEKENLSYVTDLDHDLERLIRDRLGERFPDDVLTGEEYENAGGSGPRRWSIDPIDGTGNLVHGLPVWAISIGLIDRGEPVLGVIAIPPAGELYWATRGQGAWRDGEPIRAAPDRDGFHDQDNICVGTNALRVIDPRSVVGRLRDLGSCCAELAWVSCGRLVAVCHLGEKAHDMAAGAVIASEAGCSFGTLDGRLLSPAELLASTPIRTPTFTAPPGQLKALQSGTRRLP
ncbi:inositol monophosphatase family protein [Tautonia plasticadhaerens]|uniref:Inositol-1-monophosphatase n=1 Tax=Tautonia plasticadhaerens TaxID=2527974 RepID=A0A518GW28_9BACT|nr:inositol monophosphatase [Tautonia plasticadhaerens]QDV32803.1 Inositol-1-monophosphatase [Tautonia plasticadhaerens]